MEADKKEKTALNSSVGADEKQFFQTNTINSITDEREDFNDFNENSSFTDIEFLQDLDSSYMETISMKGLFENIYQNKPALIEGLLYPGTYIFAGAPKLGKSFLMTQMAYHISTGIPLWNFHTTQGTVLYLALEDDYGRLQERLYRMFGTKITDNLFFSVSAKPLGKGLDDQLHGFISAHPNTKMIIIDTLQKIRESVCEKYSYANDYEVITRLKKYVECYNITLILVHHTRKQGSEDKFDMISGTNGLLGAADGGLILQKEKRTGNSATLEISGRDQQDQKLHLIRNPKSLLWELEKAETELWKLPPDPILDIIANFINSTNPEWCGTPTELVEKLGIELKANTLSMKLNINAGDLLNEYHIKYYSKRTHSGRKIFLSYKKA